MGLLILITICWDQSLCTCTYIIYVHISAEFNEFHKWIFLIYICFFADLSHKCFFLHKLARFWQKFSNDRRFYVHSRRFYVHSRRSSCQEKQKRMLIYRINFDFYIFVKKEQILVPFFIAGLYPVKPYPISTYWRASSSSAFFSHYWLSNK